MTDYYLGCKTVMIPFEAANDSDALKVARDFVKGPDYRGILLMNNESGRIFDMFGNNA